MLAKLKSGIEVPYEELWLNDNDLSEFIGKSFDQTQRLLRKMYKDRNYRKYIDKVGGRSTKVKKFEEWWKLQNEKIIKLYFRKTKKKKDQNGQLKHMSKRESAIWPSRRQ